MWAWMDYARRPACCALCGAVLSRENRYPTCGWCHSAWHLSVYGQLPPAAPRWHADCFYHHQPAQTDDAEGEQPEKMKNKKRKGAVKQRASEPNVG